MTSDDKKAKTNTVPKNESPSKNEALPKKNEAAPKDKSASGVAPSKAESGEKTADVPSSYSRGEGQKPVSKAYKDNWNVIFGKKKKR